MRELTRIGFSQPNRDFHHGLLGEERTSFRAILDEVRAQLALALLQDRGLSVADVAFFLQY